MRKVREVLRLKFECGRSHAEIAASTAIGETTVGDYLARARKVGLTWDDAQNLTDAEVEGRLFRDVGRNEDAHAPLPHRLERAVALRLRAIAGDRRSSHRRRSMTSLQQFHCPSMAPRR